jgi:hypothetical protein
MAESQNGWVVPPPERRTWAVVDLHGETVARIPLRDGAAGFVLAHLAAWFHDNVEQLDGKVMDDWGGANRTIRGSSQISNHASFTAMDLNATKHPLGKRGTFSELDRLVLVHRMNLLAAWAVMGRTGNYPQRRGNARPPLVIRWGGQYVNRADEMHFEIVGTVRQVENLARALATTKRGQRILKANKLVAAEVWAA